MKLSLAILLIVACGTLVGCGSGSAPKATDSTAQTAPAEPKVNGPLRVMVLDDEPLSEVLFREWGARSEHAIEMQNISASELQAQLDDGLKRLDTDVVIFPSAMLGHIVEQQLLRPVPRELTAEPEFRNTGIFPLTRRRETKWNNQTYAVPLGSPVPVLMRRTDLVPEAPNTWGELNAEVSRLTSSLPEGVVPLAQPLADGWGAKMLLVRAAAYMYDSSRVSTVFEYATMQPRVATAPFVRSLEELKDSLHHAPRDLTPASALQLFLDGKTAMAITWPSAVANETAGHVDFPIDISELPGTEERYVSSRDAWEKTEDGEVLRVTTIGLDGRMGSVSRSARNALLGNIFLSWIAGGQSGKLSPRSSHTAPFRQSHEDNAALWVNPRIPSESASTYVATVRTALSRSEAWQSPRLPGQAAYIASLDAATHRCIEDDSLTASRELGTVKQEWSQITAKRGLAPQKAAYRRDLGISIK